MYIRTRLTNPEHAALVIAAARAGQTMQDFVVDAIGTACANAARTDAVVAQVLQEAHKQDEDCAPFIVMGECQVCGVMHEGDPCPECDAKAFHKPTCSQHKPE